MVVKLSSGANYPEGITMGDNTDQDGVVMIYTANNKSYKVYGQGRGYYKSMSYWGSTIRGAGCGITSTAIILTGYGVDADPITVRDDGLCPSGVASYYVKEFAKYGISSHVQSSNIKNTILENLQAGRPCILLIRGTTVGKHYWSGGHYVTVLGMNAQGQIFLGDSGDSSNSGYYDQSNILNANIETIVALDS